MNKEPSMTSANWLRACVAWLDDPQMRSSVVEHMEEAADHIEELEGVLRSIANRESQTGYDGKQFPIESRCTVAIAYEDRARRAIDPAYAEEQDAMMQKVFKEMRGISDGA